MWARDGSEIFYWNGDKMMAVSIESEPVFRAGKPELLFQGSFEGQEGQGWVGSANYDVTPDGQRFVMIQSEQTSGEIHVVVNWFEELERLVPTDN